MSPVGTPEFRVNISLQNLNYKKINENKPFEVAEIHLVFEQLPYQRQCIDLCRAVDARAKVPMHGVSGNLLLEFECIY